MKISFCIPTYNHGRFLGAALDSILRQAPQDFEIVIVDGASIDETPAVVAQYQLKTSHILYRRMPVNRGVDPDIAETIALASGEYCWLMSSDDVLCDGAVAKVLEALQAGRALYVGGRLDCTADLVPFGENFVFRLTGGRTWDFSHEPQLLDYLNQARGLVALFSYLSVLIFRRDLWTGAPDAEARYGSCYAHAFRLWTALAVRGEVEFVHAPLVMCRMDTDNFISRGLFRRYLLDFDGYLAIADEVFGRRAQVRTAFLEAVQREHGVGRLAKFYRACADRTQRGEARSRLRAVGYSSARVLLVQALASTGPLVTAAAMLRRHARRLVGRLRYQT